MTESHLKYLPCRVVTCHNAYSQSVAVLRQVLLNLIQQMTNEKSELHRHLCRLSRLPGLSNKDGQIEHFGLSQFFVLPILMLQIFRLVAPIV